MALQYAIECKHRRAQMNNRYAEREKNFTVTSTKYAYSFTLFILSFNVVLIFLLGFSPR